MELNIKSQEELTRDQNMSGHILQKQESVATDMINNYIDRDSGIVDEKVGEIISQ